MKKRMFGLVAFMLALALVFAGCGGSESDGGSGKKPGKGGYGKKKPFVTNRRNGKPARKPKAKSQPKTR